ncbi:MAG TPA: hypothetical protein VIW47_06105 [Nitrospiraceae bacterium]
MGHLSKVDAMSYDLLNMVAALLGPTRLPQGLIPNDREHIGNRVFHRFSGGVFGAYRRRR